MNKCINCTYLITCERASEEIVECDKFKKMNYETKLVKVEGLNYKFEEVK